MLCFGTQRLNAKNSFIEGFRHFDEYVEAYTEANAENEEIDLGTNIKLIKKD